MFSLENNRDGSLSEQLEEMQKNKFYVRFTKTWKKFP